MNCRPTEIKQELQKRRKTITLILSTARIAKGYTLRQMGDVIGINAASYYKKEKGMIALFAEEFNLLAEFLELDITLKPEDLGY